MSRILDARRGKTRQVAAEALAPFDPESAWLDAWGARAGLLVLLDVLAAPALALVAALSPRRKVVLDAARAAPGEKGDALSFHGTVLFEGLVLVHDLLIFPALVLVAVASVYRLPALLRAWRGPPPEPTEYTRLEGGAPVPKGVSFPAPFAKPSLRRTAWAQAIGGVDFHASRGAFEQ